MADVAERAGVSAMTVSRALKTDSYIKQQTRERILQAVEDLGYVMDSTAAGLSSRRTGFVAAIIPSINNANFAQTVAGLTEQLNAEGLQLLLAYTNYSIAEEEKLVRQLLSRRPEAIVLVGTKHTKTCKVLLENAGIPVIETWETARSPIGYSVGFSNREASRMMVEHFVNRGCERLAFIGGDAKEDSRGANRRAGFIRACRDFGLEDPTLIDLGPAPVSMLQGSTFADELVKAAPLPQAVMCVSDLVAFGTLSRLQRLGVDVPGEMLLSGFGAYDVSSICTPSITTIDVDAYSIGKQAADIAIAAMANNSDVPCSNTVSLPITLRVRESTTA